MLTITRSGNIHIPRGDSGYFEVRRVKEGEVFPFETGDALTFTVKRKIEDPDPVIQKTAELLNGIARFSLLPSDTKPLSFGKYFFDIQSVYSDGNVDTLVGPASFVVLEEVNNA